MNGNGVFESDFEDIYDVDYGEDIGDYIEGVFDDLEGYGEDVEDYGESRASRRARARATARARARARTQNRARALAARRSFSRRAMAAATRTIPQALNRYRSAIEKVDLDGKVRGDMISGALKQQSDRISGNEYAQAFSKLVDPAKSVFPQIEDNELLKNAVPLLPLLFLKPQKKGSGVESVLRDPRWLAAIAVGLIALYGSKEQEAKELRITGGTEKMGVSAQRPLQVVALDAQMKEIKCPQLVFGSTDISILEVDQSGTMRAKAAGKAKVTVNVYGKPTVSTSVDIDVENKP